jgi:thiol:disulfide interchange protein
MPFGAVYASLFFVIVGFWLTVATLGSAGSSLQMARLCLAMVCLVLGLALLLRRSWARWLGVAVSLFLVGFHLWATPLGDGVAPNLVLFGSLAALILLVIPATGDSARTLPGAKPPAPRFGRALGVLASLGLVGFAAGLWLGVAPTVLSDAPATDDETQTRPTIAGLSERVQWSSFGQGIDLARAEGKPLLINFIANWCGYCQKMDRTTWKHPEVVRRSGDLVAVRVDAEEGRQRDGFVGRELAQRYQVQGFPTLVVIDADGNVIARSSGYQDPRQFLGWLDGALARAGRTGFDSNLSAVSSP